MKRISIITPFLNEEDNLSALRKRLDAVLHSMVEYGYEVVLVDDHSTDQSPLIARQWARDDANVQYLRLSRNFGSHAALTAGLANCTGDGAVLIAADLQDPPELIPELVQRWQTGHEVVWAVRAERQGETWSTKLLAGIYYGLMRRYALPQMPPRGADFLLMDRKVIDAFNQNVEKNTSILALIHWLGFSQTSLEYTKQARREGQSKWTWSKKVKLFIDSVVSFSYAPIRFMSGIGLLMALAGVCYAAVVVIGWLAGSVNAGTGFAALMTVLLVGQGLILMMLGVLGEYLWRTFDSARSRRHYIIEEIIKSRATPIP